MTTLILIQSPGDNIICAKNHHKFMDYALTMFRKITLKEIPTLYDPKQIPNSLKAGEFFMIQNVELNSALSSDEVGWKATITLYSVYEKETGWIRSLKVKRGKPLKTISGECIEMFDVVNKENDFDRLLKETYAPLNWEKDEVSKRFVENMCDIDPDIKQEFMNNASKILTECETTVGRKNKEILALELYTKLSEPEGMQFIHHNWKFYKTCRSKLLDFYYIDNFKEIGPFYEKIFGHPMPTSHTPEPYLYPFY